MMLIFNLPGAFRGNVFILNLLTTNWGQIRFIFFSVSPSNDIYSLVPKRFNPKIPDRINELVIKFLTKKDNKNLLSIISIYLRELHGKIF